MEVARDLDEVSIGDVLSEVSPVNYWDDRIAGAVHNERWYAQGAERVADVHVHVVVQDLCRRPRRSGLAFKTPESLQHVVIHAADERFERMTRTPLVANARDERFDKLRIRSGFVVGALQDTREGSPQHQRADSLGKSGREQDGERAAFGQANHHRLLDTGGVGDRSGVVHPVLGTSGTERPIRTTSSPLVEEYEPAKLREPGEEVSPFRDVPHQLDVRNEPRDEQQVERTIAHTLVGDAQLATLRVLRLRHRTQP